MTNPPELFVVGGLVDPICQDSGCSIKENPDHFVTIELSSYVKETLAETAKYLEPDVKNSPLAEVLYARLLAILEAGAVI